MSTLHAHAPYMHEAHHFENNNFWRKKILEKRWFGENDSLGFSFKERGLYPKISWLLLNKLKGNKVCAENFLWKQQSLKKVLEERKIIPMHFSLKKGFWIQKSHGFCSDDKSFEKKGFVLKTSLWKHQSWTKQKKLFKEKVSMDFYFIERCLEPKIPWFLLRW